MRWDLVTGLLRIPFLKFQFFLTLLMTEKFCLVNILFINIFLICYLLLLIFLFIIMELIQNGHLRESLQVNQILQIKPNLMSNPLIKQDLLQNYVLATLKFNIGCCRFVFYLFQAILNYSDQLNFIKISIMQKGYSALIYGSTGSIGRDLVQQLLNSPNWQRVHVVARRQLQQWAQHPNKSKLSVQLLKDMDELLKPEQFKYKGFDSLFCCLGSQTKHGEETFVKVDKTYPLKAADIALQNSIPHYLLVSSIGADQKSWFLYPRTKGQVQRELRTKKLPLLSIFRPGILQERHGARFGQKIGSYIPFFPKILAKDAATVLRKTAQRDIEKGRKAQSEVQLYENKHMLQILKI